MKSTSVAANDGFILHLTEFGNDAIMETTIIFNCATAVPQQFYYKYARFLSDYGYQCICWDYRGIGKSNIDGIKNKNYSLHHWGNLDMSAILNYAKNTYPKNKIIIFGHSIGGAILGFTPNYDLIDGIIAYAVQTAYFKDWRFPYNIRLLLEWHVMLPLVAYLYGYFPGKKFGLGTDIPKGYISHWQNRMKHPDIQYLFTKMGTGKIFFDQYKCPILCFNMTDDYIATPKAIERMNLVFENARIDSIWLDPKEYGFEKIGHFDFFKEKYKDKLWTISLKWLERIT